jgi:rod shape-determining protein MreD
MAVGPTHVAPSFLIPFVVFIAMYAPPVPTLWLALVLGAAVDLTSPRGAAGYVVLGPYAIGYIVAAYLVLTMRGLMFRRSPLTVVFLSVLASAMAELIVVACLSARAAVYHEALGWNPSAELVNRLLSSAYTAFTAGLLSLILLPMAPLFGFQEATGRRFARRGTH